MPTTETTVPLTEKRVREIARDELMNFFAQAKKTHDSGVTVKRCGKK